MICSVTDEIIEELFEYLLQGHQEWVEESMRGIVFILIVLMYYIAILMESGHIAVGHIKTLVNG